MIGQGILNFFCLPAKLEAFLNVSLVINMKDSVRSLHGKIHEYSSKTSKCDSKVERKEKRQCTVTISVLPSLK